MAKLLRTQLLPSVSRIKEPDTKAVMEKLMTFLDDTFKRTYYTIHSTSDIVGLAKTDGNFIVGDGNSWVAESDDIARTSLGLGTGHSPTFAGLIVDTNTLVVDAGNNRVGIGTASPDTKLEVAGTEIRIRTSITPKLSLWTDGANADCRNWVLRISHIVFGDFNIVQSNLKGGNPIGAGTSRLYIGKTGNVGIGDTVPASVLDVTGDINTTEQYKVDDVQVVGNRVIDARCDDAVNSGDATTDGVIDALRDAMITHGLIAAA